MECQFVVNLLRFVAELVTRWRRTGFMLGGKLIYVGDGLVILWGRNCYTLKRTCLGAKLPDIDSKMTIFACYCKAKDFFQLEKTKKPSPYRAVLLVISWILRENVKAHVSTSTWNKNISICYILPLRNDEREVKKIRSVRITDTQTSHYTWCSRQKLLTSRDIYHAWNESAQHLSSKWYDFDLNACYFEPL